MSYEDLKAHAAEIKKLAIDKTVDQGIQATSGAAAYGGTPPIGYLQDYAEKMFADTDTCFDAWIGMPDPDILESHATNAQTVVSKLSSESYLTNDNAKKYAGGGGTTFNISQIEPTGAFMQGWQSGTATSYANFAGMFGPVTANLSMCASVLHGTIKAEAAIWREGRKSVDALAHATIDALKNCTDKDPDDIGLALTVLGAISGIVAVPFTAGGSLVASYSFAAIAAGTSVGGAFVPKDDKRDTTITGDTPSEIVSSLFERLKTLDQDLVSKENDVSKSLRDTVGDYSSALGLEPGKSPVKMPRPSVADHHSLGGHD